MKILACRLASTSLLSVRSSECGASCPSLVPGQALETMEDSSEIKVETGISKTSWIRSSLATIGKRVHKALGYITGEMKECGEGLKGKRSTRAAPAPTPEKVPSGCPLGNMLLGSL